MIERKIERKKGREREGWRQRERGRERKRGERGESEREIGRER